MSTKYWYICNFHWGTSLFANLQIPKFLVSFVVPCSAIQIWVYRGKNDQPQLCYITLGCKIEEWPGLQSVSTTWVAKCFSCLMNKVALMVDVLSFSGFINTSSRREKIRPEQNLMCLYGWNYLKKDGAKALPLEIGDSLLRNWPEAKKNIFQVTRQNSNIRFATNLSTKFI